MIGADVCGGAAGATRPSWCCLVVALLLPAAIAILLLLLLLLVLSPLLLHLCVLLLVATKVNARSHVISIEEVLTAEEQAQVGQRLLVSLAHTQSVRRRRVGY
jgi:hypothetical protein